MIPVTVIPAPGSASGAPDGVMTPGGGGSGSPLDGGGNVPGDCPSSRASGANGSGRPRPTPGIPRGVDDGRLGETRLSDEVEGAFAAGLVGPVAGGGSVDAIGREVSTRTAGGPPCGLKYANAMRAMATIPMSQGSAFLRPREVIDVSTELRLEGGIDGTVSLEPWGVIGLHRLRAHYRPNP